jgi:hypothetical protein
MERLCRLERFAEVNHLLRNRRRQHLGEPLRSAGAGQHTDQDFRHADRRFLGHDTKIADQRQFAAAAEGQPVDRRDRRPVQIVEGVEGLLDILDMRHEVAAGLDTVQARDIGARAKRASIAGEHDDADVFVGADMGGEFAELPDHHVVDRIELVGPIQPHQRNPVRQRIFKRLVHRILRRLLHNSSTSILSFCTTRRLDFVILNRVCEVKNP